MKESNASWSIINIMFLFIFYMLYSTSGNVIAGEGMVVSIIAFFCWGTPERYRYLDIIYKRKKQNVAFEKIYFRKKSWGRYTYGIKQLVLSDLKSIYCFDIYVIGQISLMSGTVALKVINNNNADVMLIWSAFIIIPRFIAGMIISYKIECIEKKANRSIYQWKPFLYDKVVDEISVNVERAILNKGKSNIYAARYAMCYRPVRIKKEKFLHWKNLLNIYEERGYILGEEQTCNDGAKIYQYAKEEKNNLFLFYFIKTKKLMDTHLYWMESLFEEYILEKYQTDAPGNRILLHACIWEDEKSAVFTHIMKREIFSRRKRCLLLSGICSETESIYFPKQKVLAEKIRHENMKRALIKEIRGSI